MLKVQLCCPQVESRFPFAVPGEIMQTQADVASDTELCESISSTVVPEEDVPAMTVKQEEEEAAVLCQTPEPPPPPPPAAATTAEAPVVATNTELLSPEEQPKLSDSPPGSSLETQNDNKVEKGRGRGRRRSRWKLKFHHQALPPEYLDHYEASIAQQEAKSNAIHASVKAVHGSRGNNDKTQSKHSVKQAHGARSCEKSTSDVNSLAEKSSKQSSSPVHCLQVKLEPESQSLPFGSIVQASPLLLNATSTIPEQSRLMPLQTMGTDNDMISRLQDTFQSHHIDDDISIINETRGSPPSNSNKGLLGCLLSSNPQPSEMPSPTQVANGNRCVPTLNTEQRQNANAKRRSSVIMTSSSAVNTNFTTGTSTQQQGSTSKVMKYQDLPYMGEITLDNMKPRRGRKPKKADICHLIYKNYGTIFPGAPNSTESEDIRKKVHSETLQEPSLPANKGRLDSSTSLGIKCKSIETLKSSSGTQINHADVQNRIISSLLEKRLTAAAQLESNRKSFLQNSNIPDYSTLMLPPNCSGAWNKRTIPMPLSSPVLPTPSPSTTPACNDEPLNLCVKDLNQLKIRLLRKHGNFYEPHSSSTTNSSEEGASMKHRSNMSPISVKSEPPSHVSDLEEMLEVSNDSLKYPGTPDESCADGSRRETPVQSSGLNESFQSSPVPGLSFPAPADIPGAPPAASPLPAGYVYWPGAGVFVHPMAIQSQLLYYQKMGAIPLVSMPGNEAALSTQTFIPAAPVSIPHLAPNSLPPPQSPKSTPTMPKPDQKQSLSATNSKHIIPKNFSSTSQVKNSNLMPSELSFPRMKRLPSLGNAASAISGGAKRKRSAIFIPPMPSENNSSPTTEVSICKFKFTGGAKPSLQEKKMLSVDSGGNFRYYSGTGDKSMRGYEFFPRESLQQPAGVTGGSPSEHFLAAAASASEKMTPSVATALRENPAVGTYSLDEHRKFLSSNPADAMAKGISSSFSELNPSVVLSQEGDSSRKMGDGSGFLDHTARKKSDTSEIMDSSVVNVGDTQQGPSSQHFRFQRRKRKTRKSLAREKLEQTFKEKGFLIQTQQLESAEGATYCKFRQLRKFTRYLFRSWKDYLPGNVREMSVAAGVAGSSPSHQDDSDGEVSSNSPTPTMVTPQITMDDTASKPSPTT